jgi:hypothetical protein
MPITIADNEGRSARTYWTSKNFQYQYPLGLNLHPTQTLAQTIVDKVMNRAVQSSSVISNRYPSWARVDEMLTGFIVPSKDALEAKRKNRRKPVEIVVPEMYAIMEILLTYMTSALLDGPVFQYDGTAPEDLIGAILLEKVVDQQIRYTKGRLALHTGFRDAFAYGFGLLAPEWTKKYATVIRKVPQAPSFFDKILGRNPPDGRDEREEMIFEGNRINNIDPYLALPDPNVPIDRINDGEFFGWIDRTSYKNLLEEEHHDDNYFNVKYLQDVTSNNGNSRLFQTGEDGRGRRSGIPNYNDLTPVASGRIDVVKMFIDIIPRDWKLPGGWNNKNGEYPEAWYFEVAADTVLIQCRRLGLNHGQKPVAAIAPDYDGYSISPISRMEMMSGFQEVSNFLFNSHITNVRKSLNDMFVVDPQMIDMRSLQDPEPGKIITLRPNMWGKGVQNAVEQLKVVDITASHMKDLAMIQQYAKDMSGATDVVSGIRRKTSERVTAQEIQGDQHGALSRLERMAKIMGWMGMWDLSNMIASQTQQLMSQETYIKIVGNWPQELMQEYGVQVNKERVKVSPDDLLINYDIKCRDGTIPGGNFNQVWVQLLPQLMQNKELMQSFDIVRIVKHIMRASGADDVDQFDRPQQQQQQQQSPQINAQVMPNEQVQNEVQKGNLVPIGAQ